jgi:DNA-binding transcriptional LysR family regulator
MRPSVHQLEYFVAVAEEGQFTRAAARLRVAQPSVSAQIRQLERSLGTRLLHRGAGPVRVTDAGNELLPLARRVLADLDDVEQAMVELAGLRRGQLAVGATPSLSAWLLPTILGRFHDQYPGVSLTVTEQGSRHLVRGLEAGVLDLALAILPLPQPTLQSQRLAVEELVVVTATDHELAGRTSTRIAELKDVALVMFREGYDLRNSTLAAFAAIGSQPTVAVEGGEMGSVLALVAEGLGAAIVPSIVATDPHLHVLTLRSPKLYREIGLVRRQDRVPSRAAEAMCDVITSLISGSGWPGTVPSGLRLLLK